MIKQDYTLVPSDYKAKDPRPLTYLFPGSINLVAYTKQLQVFNFYQQLEVVEQLAHNLGYILLPFSCMHWERAKKFGYDRKVKIGRKSYFLLRPDEMTKGEKRKLESYINEEE